MIAIWCEILRNPRVFGPKIEEFHENWPENMKKHVFSKQQNNFIYISSKRVSMPNSMVLGVWGVTFAQHFAIFGCEYLFVRELLIFLTLSPTRKRSANPSARHFPRANSFLKHENLRTVEQWSLTICPLQCRDDIVVNYSKEEPMSAVSIYYISSLLHTITRVLIIYFVTPASNTQLYELRGSVSCGPNITESNRTPRIGHFTTL